VKHKIVKVTHGINKQINFKTEVETVLWVIGIEKYFHFFSIKLFIISNLKINSQCFKTMLENQQHNHMAFYIPKESVKREYLK
jgi:hypothetical protein